MKSNEHRIRVNILHTVHSNSFPAFSPALCRSCFGGCQRWQHRKNHPQHISACFSGCQHIKMSSFASALGLNHAKASKALHSTWSQRKSYEACLVQFSRQHWAEGEEAWEDGRRHVDHWRRYSDMLCRIFYMPKMWRFRKKQYGKPAFFIQQATSKPIHTRGSCLNIIGAWISLDPAVNYWQLFVTLNDVLMMPFLSLRSEFRKL